MIHSNFITRRKFIKLSLLGMGSFWLIPGLQTVQDLPVFPQSDRLGRICAGEPGAHFDLYLRPDSDSPSTGTVFRDDVVPWLQEVVASNLNLNVINQRWVETDNGYIYADNVQPVKNLPNQPVTDLPANENDKGAWVEVTVPYVDFTLDSYPPKSPWLKITLKPRLYYSQIMWADQLKTDDQGQVLYRVREKFGSFGDIFWAPAEAFRLLTDDDIMPINPGAEDKKIIVDLTYQSLSCFEGNNEVYYCRISSGGKFDAQGNPVDTWATPIGSQPIWRKSISIHMVGGSTGAGYDTPGIGWSSFFDSKGGAAIHSTFWHNGFGVARSHGCVNATPEDAKWIFRWTGPNVVYDPGDMIISGMNVSTRVNVIES